MSLPQFVWMILTMSLLLYIIFSSIAFTKKVQRAYALSDGATPLERKRRNAEKRLLIIGDSTAVGTGAKRKQNSISGRFAKDFPGLDIHNKALNGQKTHDMLKYLFPKNKNRYTSIIIIIGGNDIMRFTPYKKIKKVLPRVLQSAKRNAKNVVLMLADNVGIAPIFPPIPALVYTHRTKRYRKIFWKIAMEENVQFVDYFNKKSDLKKFSKNPIKLYARDLIHPSDLGYKYWYRAIRKTMDQAKIRMF